MLPKLIEDILDDSDPEDLQIVIEKVNYEFVNPTFDIQLSAIKFNEGDNIVQHWTIEPYNYRTCNFSLGFASTLQIDVHHPLLWQFSDIQSSMYFSGHCSNPDRLFIELYKIHTSLVENFISFDDVLHRISDFETAMKSASGLFAIGPKKLLMAYAECAKKYNLKSTIIGDRIPTYWNGEQHIEESGQAKVLFLDDSYIIADAFNFIQK